MSHKGVTKKDIEILKNTKAINFITRKEKATIECFNDILNIKGTHKINVDSKIEADHQNYICFYTYSIYPRKLCPVKTMISLLEEEDTIRLVWNRGAGNTYELEKNGFSSDYFYIEVYRKGAIKYNFLINVDTTKNKIHGMIIPSKGLI